MKETNEIKWAIILLVVNAFLSVTSISATYRAAKYSIEGQKYSYAIDAFVQAITYSEIFLFLSIVMLLFGFFMKKKKISKWCNRIAFLLIILGLIVMFMPYFSTGF